jgi:hypothetical protein
MRAVVAYSFVFIFMSQIYPSVSHASCEQDLLGSLRMQLARVQDELAKPEEERTRKDPRMFKRNPETNPVTLSLREKIGNLVRQIAAEERFERARIEFFQTAPTILGRNIKLSAATAMARAQARLDVNAIEILGRFKGIAEIELPQGVFLDDPEIALLTVMSMENGKSPRKIVGLFLEVMQATQALRVEDMSNIKIAILTLGALRTRLPPRDIGRRFVKATLDKAYDGGQAGANYLHAVSTWNPTSSHFMSGATLDFVTGNGGMGDNQMSDFGFGDSFGINGSDSTRMSSSGGGF